MTKPITALRSNGSAAGELVPHTSEAAFVARTVDHLVCELFGARSIHDVLSSRAAQCDAARDDFAALAPCPEVNGCLGRLVDIARARFDGELPERTRSLAAHALWRRIVESPALTRKAHELRRIAACAETQLEHHHCHALLGVWADVSRMCSLRDAFASFPYYDNYAHLVAAERALLAGARHDIIAVCGCGPLPLTSLLLQQHTSAQLVLIDRDARALAGAAKLVRELARLGVLDARAFSFVHADAGELTYGRSDTIIICDAALVASLVPHAVKLRIAQRVLAPTSLVLRSAAGLCSELAYEPVRTQQFRDLGLVYCGESVPRHQRLDARRGLDALTTPRELRVAADASVLNTSELYASRPRARTVDRVERDRSHARSLRA